MKQLILTTAAACLGAMAGITFTTALPTRSEAFAPPPTIRTRLLEITDEKGAVAARIQSENGSAVLEFFSNGQPVIQIGSAQGGTQFVRMLGPNGRVVASINALPPDGASTLYLGDSRQEARIVVGALMAGDIPKIALANDWGIQVRQPESAEPLMTILARTPGNGHRSTVALRMHRSDGRVWSEY